MPRILLADDSTHAQRMGAKILSAEGFEVTTVGNGQAAIQSLKQNLPDLIVADIFMPGRNGYEVCQHIKKDSKLNHIPVLLIIGAMEPYDPEEGKRSGADGLITKPLESSNLVATVRDLLTAAARKFPAKSKPAEPEPAPKPEPIKSPSSSGEWGSEMQDFTTNTAAAKMEIPHEVSQQAVGMFADLMDHVEEPPLSPIPSMEAAASAAVIADPPAMVEPAPVEPETQSVPVQIAEPENLMTEILQRDPLLESARTFGASVEVVEPPKPAVVWTAEPAPITAEEEKLFDQPAGNWGDLTQMVEESGAAPASMASSAASSVAAVVEAASEPEPSYEVIASPADRSTAEHLTADPAWEPPAAATADNTQMLEELEVAEAGGTFAPASSFRSSSAEAQAGSKSPFGAVVPMPVETAPSESSSSAVAEPTPSESSVPEVSEPLAAVQPAIEEVKTEVKAEAAEPAVTAKPDELDPEMEQRVRERLEQLMPDIIEQVKKSLKK